MLQAEGQFLYLLVYFSPKPPFSYITIALHFKETIDTVKKYLDAVTSFLEHVHFLLNDRLLVTSL